MQAIRNLLGNIDLWAICFVNSSLEKKMVKMCFWIDQKGKEIDFPLPSSPIMATFSPVAIVRLDHERVHANPWYVLWLGVESVS